MPGPHEILVKVESVGLCFSDVKLMKQFSDHPRKDNIRAGIDPEILEKFRSYTPGDQTRRARPRSRLPHSCRRPRGRAPPRRRTLPGPDGLSHSCHTRGANAAFGYTFEGGLQEYVLLDERIVIEPGTGERFRYLSPRA